MGSKGGKGSQVGREAWEGGRELGFVESSFPKQVQSMLG